MRAWRTLARSSPAVLLAAAGLWLFWGPPLPPFQDMLAQAGLVALRALLSPPASDPAALAEANALLLAPTFGPYSLYRGVGALLSSFLGPLGAVRMLASVAWLGLPCALVHARWRLHRIFRIRDVYGGLLLGLGLNTLLGLTSFQIGALLLLVTNAEWLAHVRRPTTKSFLRVAALASLVFVAHGFAFVLGLLLATIAWCILSPKRTAVLAAWLPALALAAWASIAVLHTNAPTLTVQWQPRFEPLGAKLALLLSPTLMTRFGLDAALCLLLWPLALSLLWHARNGAAASRALSAQAAALLALFFLLPHSIGWFGFVDARILPTALALALLSEPSRTSRITHLVDRGLPLAAALSLGCALVAAKRFETEAYGAHEVMDEIPAGSRLLHVPLDPDSRFFAVHPFLHYDKLPLIDRSLVVSDLWFHQGSAVYPRSAHPALRLPTSRYAVPDAFAWSAVDLTAWDFVLVRTTPDHPPPALPSALALAAHEGGFWLYRVTKAE